MKDQQEAEKKKVTSQEIQEQLGVQTEHIKEKKKVVLDDLSKVEPAVKEAQQGNHVQGLIGRWRNLGSGISPTPTPHPSLNYPPPPELLSIIVN